MTSPLPSQELQLPSSEIQECVPCSDNESLSNEVPFVGTPNISSFLDSSSSRQISTFEKTTEKKWDKKHSCKFCKKMVTKMSTHLRLCHNTESEVAFALSFKKGSKERRVAWGKLLNEGDFQHNFEVLESGNGKLIPKYRGVNKTVDDFVVCAHCKGLYNKSLLYQHNLKCFMRENPVKSAKGHAVKNGRLIMPVPKNVSTSFYEKVVMRMKQDDILRLIQNDHLIILYGERSFYRKDLEEHTHNIISCRMRELGRLLKCLREKSEMKIPSLTQALHPSNFDIVLQCVRHLADFDEGTNTFRKGSVAMRLGHSLKKCAAILKSEAIKKDDKELEEIAESFNNLFSGDWYDYVSATASQSMYRAKANKPKLLPTLADIEKVHRLLGEKLKSTEYSALARSTLCSITLFNRKRGGEVQRLKTQDLENGLKNGTTADPVLLEGLSDTERKMVSYFDRIEIRGKFNRTVPILLTKTMLECLKKLKELRMEMDPPISSEYFFCTKSGERPYRGVDVIKEFAKEAGVSDLQVFTFTTLRKHVATLTQSFEISKLDQDQLASFLGHDIRVHRSFYRRPIDIVEKAKVAKILLAANKGITLPWDETDEIDQELEEDEAVKDTEEDQSGMVDKESEVCDTEGKEPHTTVEESFDMPDTTVAEPIDSSKRKFNRQPWSTSEVDAVKRQLGHCITTRKVPQKSDAMKAISSEPSLRKRTWKNVKDYVYNQIKKSKF